jgi:hypothetical protein
VIDLTWWYSHDQAEGDVTRTPAEVDGVLDRLAALSRSDWPALAEVTRAQGDLQGPLLYVGLHVDLGTLRFQGRTILPAASAVVKGHRTVLRSCTCTPHRTVKRRRTARYRQRWSVKPRTNLLTPAYGRPASTGRPGNA